MMKNLLSQTNILLGVTELNELVFANINVRENKTLSISFSLVVPTIIDNEYLYEQFAELVSSLPKEHLYDLCEQYNVAPSNLIDELFYYTTPEQILDLSLFPEQIEVNGDEWVFESAGCGQVETRNTMCESVDKDAYMRLITLWKAYHLQSIDDYIIKEVETIIEKLNEVDQLEWIKDYIIENNYR